MLRYRMVIVLVAIAVSVAVFHESSASDARIMPNQVTLSNVEAFKEQMRGDLPVGTAKTTVEEYLARWKILHSFYGPEYGPNFENTFGARIPDIGRRLGLFPVDLNIRIYLDSSDRLREISFREFTEAP
jgi:hypothetical protein